MVATVYAGGTAVAYTDYNTGNTLNAASSEGAAVTWLRENDLTAIVSGAVYAPGDHHGIEYELEVASIAGFANADAETRPVTGSKTNNRIQNSGNNAVYGSGIAHWKDKLFVTDNGDDIDGKAHGPFVITLGSNKRVGSATAQNSAADAHCLQCSSLTVTTHTFKVYQRMFLKGFFAADFVKINTEIFRFGGLYAQLMFTLFTLR
jgi:hypothetical protein